MLPSGPRNRSRKKSTGSVGGRLPSPARPRQAGEMPQMMKPSWYSAMWECRSHTRRGYSLPTALSLSRRGTCSSTNTTAIPPARSPATGTETRAFEHGIHSSAGRVRCRHRARPGRFHGPKIRYRVWRWPQNSSPAGKDFVYAPNLERAGSAAHKAPRHANRNRGSAPHRGRAGVQQHIAAPRLVKMARP